MPNSAGVVVVAAACLAAMAPVARGADAVFSAAVDTRSASATFQVSGSNLIVTLTNTSALDAMVPTDALTGVFFDVAGAALLLGRSSAVLNAGSVVNFGPTDPGGVVGGEWAYLGALAGAPHGAKYGISSAGLGLFGAGDRFPGNDLAPPPSPDGPNYSITTAGDNPLTGNAVMTGGVPLIQNSVVFTLSGLPAGFNPLTAIGNVSFQYGTVLDEPNVPGTAPAPGAAALFGLAGLVGLRRRR